MILTASEIKQQVCTGRITISPYENDLVNPNSYNYRLGEYLSVITDNVIDPKFSPGVETIKIPDEGYMLMPNTLYLGHTLETLGSKEYVTSLIGRSSVGRLGLYMQVTADLGQLGEAHSWTLELKVVQPLKIYPRMKIGQVSFWKPLGEVSSLYSDRYTAHSVPRYSAFHEGGYL